LGKKNCYKLIPRDLIKFTEEHELNGEQYHFATDNCQSYVQILLEKIDPKLIEKLPRKFSDTKGMPRVLDAIDPHLSKRLPRKFCDILLGQAIAGNC
jgi:hypothetical protein